MNQQGHINEKTSVRSEKKPQDLLALKDMELAVFFHSFVKVKSDPKRGLVRNDHLICNKCVCPGILRTCFIYKTNYLALVVLYFTAAEYTRLYSVLIIISQLIS